MYMHTHANICTRCTHITEGAVGSGLIYVSLKNVTFLSGTSAALDFHFFSLLSTFFSAACHWLQTGAYKPRLKLFLQSTAQPYQSSEITLEGKGVASHITVTHPLTDSGCRRGKCKQTLTLIDSTRVMSSSYSLDECMTSWDWLYWA